MDARTFAAARSRRFGTANPTRMDVPFWHHMVRTGEPAYAPRREYDPEWILPEPVWCFNRYGSTRTALPDGRVVCIGGEHEDYYDPDFCIYNDVIVVHPDATVEIYGYPREAFPPIDFHTATLCGDRIVLVGGLGYHDERGGDHTPVFNLDLKTFAITRLVATGSSPGWVYGHHADLREDGRTLAVSGGKVICGRGKDEKAVKNEVTAELDLSTLAWQPAPRRSTDARPKRDWPYPWEPVSAKQVEYVMNGLRKEVPLGHPLFAANVFPLAQHFDRVLFQLLDGTGRVASVTLTDDDHHAVLPNPVTTLFDGVDAAIAALGEQGSGE